MSYQSVNRRCAELLYPDAEDIRTSVFGGQGITVCFGEATFLEIDIYTNPSQRDAVVDKLIQNHVRNGDHAHKLAITMIHAHGIKQALLNFIESALEE